MMGVCSTNLVARFHMIKSQGINMMLISATSLHDNYPHYQLRERVRKHQMNLIIELPRKEANEPISYATELFSKLMACADVASDVYIIAPSPTSIGSSGKNSSGNLVTKPLIITGAAWVLGTPTQEEL